jgi:hypothetical protein
MSCDNRHRNNRRKSGYAPSKGVENMSRKNRRSKGKPRGKRNHSASKKAGLKKVARPHKLGRLTLRQQDERVRCLAAINRRRRGEASSLSAAARAEGTTIRAIRTLVPAAIVQDRPGGRIRVTTSDRYSAIVQVLTNGGSMSVTARGSRQRELAGRHRAAVLRVLQGREPQSALEQYRGKKVGGHELISDYELLSSLAQAGVVGQLDSLYVSPDASV